MATIIVMPQLSPTMETGVLLKWTKKEGDRIMPGDVIAEVETDKANMDFPLEEEGTLLKLLVKEGETVKLGAPVAVLGEPGEDPASATAEGTAPVAAAPSEAAPVQAAPVEEQETVEQPEAVADKPEGETRAASTAPTAQTTQKENPAAAPATKATTAAPVKPAATPPAAAAKAGTAAAPATKPIAGPTTANAAAQTNGGTLRASPVARKLARETDVDLRSVVGTGPHGRVIKRDIEAAAAKEPAPVEKARPAAAVFAPGVDTIIPLSPMRRTIARRLTEAKATVPHFYVTMDARVDALWDFHQQIKSELEEKVSLNDLILKGVAVALRRLPEANASYSDEGIVRHGRVDLGIAVSIEDGLVTPVLRNADQKSLGAIARETRDLIDRARARKLRPDEFTGGTFSVSNMGMYGVKSFAAVINPPEGGILAVGAIERRVVVVSDDKGEDRFEAHRMMSLTVSADHRVVDGALAARLVGEIVKVLERPLSMVL